MTTQKTKDSLEPLEAIKSKDTRFILEKEILGGGISKGNF
jgi:hypothetical protein